MELLFIVAIAIGVGIFLLNQSRKRDEAWVEAAGILNAAYSKNGHRTIVGKLSGSKFRIATRSEGSGKSSKTVTDYHISFPQPLRLGLKVTPQGVFSSITTAFKSQKDIVIGDTSIDTRAIIEGYDEAKIRNFMTPKRRLAIKKIISTSDSFEITDKAIHVTRRGVDAYPGMIATNVRNLVNGAKTISEQEEATPTPQPEPVNPDMSEPPPIPKKDAEESPPPLPAKEIPEVEPIKEPDPVEEIVPIAPALVEEVVEETEAAPEKQAVLEAEVVEEKAAPLVEEPKSEPVPVVPTPTPPPTEVKASVRPSEPDAGRIALALFSGEKKTRFAMNREFDAKFKGTSMIGEGILRSVQKYSSDLVFGRGPGIVAQVELGELKGGKNVHAQVKFDSKTDVSALKDKIGETVLFLGKAVKLDPFTHRIFIDQED